MTRLSTYTNLQKAFELLASDNGMEMQTQASVLVPAKWRELFEVADSQAGYLDGKPIGELINCEPFSGEVSDDEDALEYMVNGSTTIVEVLIKEAEVQALHDVLNAAFDGELHAVVFITRRRQRHAR